MKKKQRQWRKDMYALMATNDDWHKNEDSAVYKRIAELGQYLAHNTEDYKKRPFNPDKYLELVKQGRMQREIADYFRITQNNLRELREKHNLS